MLKSGRMEGWLWNLGVGLGGECEKSDEGLRIVVWIAYEG